jgi:hypothetical protein
MDSQFTSIRRMMGYLDIEMRTMSMVLFQMVNRSFRQGNIIVGVRIFRSNSFQNVLMNSEKMVIQEFDFIIRMEDSSFI